MAALTSAPLISVEEYLHTVYRPDVDYVDGVIEERNLGENQHSDLQSELITLFRNHRGQWHVKTYGEHRVQVSPTRFRIPDLCVMPGSWAKTAIIHEAPLLCIEVLSPKDTLKRMTARCQDYFATGVPEVWIFDPAACRTFVLRGSNPIEHRGDVLRLEGTFIEVSLAEVFSVLERHSSTSH
jgi:Uma2 family endonuclease